MRTRTSRLALILTLLLALLPDLAFSQESIPPPEVMLPIPLGGERFRRQGTGLWFAAEFLFMQQTNPLRSQTVAYRGFVDITGQATGSPPGTFIGSHTPALNVSQLNGSTTFQPGLALSGGWRFQDGTILELSWWHLTDARYSASASVIPKYFAVGPQLADTFLTSPVYNFSTYYAGAAQNLAVGNVGDTYGIWNAATEMQIMMLQRFDQGMINLRIPIELAPNQRMYGIVGGRGMIMWERFSWRTVSRDNTGQATDSTTAMYSNTVSNRIYGANIGCAYDWYCGSSPLGAFAISVEVQGALGIDVVKERARYELADRSTASSRNVNDYTLAPVLQGDLSLWWYPYEGIQCRFGWNALAAFNTVASRNPIDFNVGGVSPHWQDGVTRLLNGFHVGVGFIF